MSACAETSARLADAPMSGMSLGKMNRETLNISWLGKCSCGLSSVADVSAKFVHSVSEQKAATLPSLQATQTVIDSMGIVPQL